MANKNYQINIKTNRKKIPSICQTKYCNFRIVQDTKTEQIRSDPLQKLEIPKTIKHPFINLKIYSQRTVTI